MPRQTRMGVALLLANALGACLVPPPADAQLVEVPTFAAGTPTLEERLMDGDVAVGIDGSLLFLWVEIDSVRPANYESGRALVRRFSQQGVPLGPATRVDTTKWVNVDVSPTISTDTRGGYVAAWNVLEPQSPGYLVELYGRFFDGAGLAVDGDFQVPVEQDANLSNTVGDAVVGLPGGAVFGWIEQGRVWGQLYDTGRALRGAPFEISAVSGPYTLDLDVTPDGGFVVAWTEGPSQSWGRIYDPDGQPRGPRFVIESTSRVQHLAASPFGGLAAVGARMGGGATSKLWLRHFDESGGFLGEEMMDTGVVDATLQSDLAYDENGNLFTAWSAYTASGYLPGRARAYDVNGVPVGPAIDLDAGATIVMPHVAALAGGRFVTAWLNPTARQIQANVIALCTPGLATCGDAVVVSQCEQCDDGPANSDTSPDACRTDCRRARCGDGVVDSSEQCDDGGRLDGDCCSASCQTEEDFDGDGVCDPGDNCPLFPNPDQSGADICRALPYKGLTDDEAERFFDGLEEFSEIEKPATGLGPVFNGASCAECHNEPTLGGSSVRFVTRFGRTGPNGFDAMIEVGGPLLQTQGVSTAECSVPGEVVPATATFVGRRDTPPLFGLGLVDGIPDDRILRLADSDDRNRDDISGRPNLIGGRVARFGWKAGVVTLRQFAGQAYRDEMGVTSPAFPSEHNPQGGPVQCDKVADPEDDDSDVAAFSDFLTMLAPLPPTPLSSEARWGRALFKRARCQACHTSKLRSGLHPIAPLQRKRVKLFSDLLLHDMGPDLADGIVEGEANGSEFRTAPLWGVRESAPYLHDGRAATLADAVSAHGGEGAAARDRFLALSVSDRAALIAYLTSL